jgi:hypothetical protein
MCEVMGPQLRWSGQSIKVLPEYQQAWQDFLSEHEYHLLTLEWGHTPATRSGYRKEQDMSDQQQQNPQPEQNPQPQQQPDTPAPVEPAPVDQPATTQEQQDTEG